MFEHPKFCRLSATARVAATRSPFGVVIRVLIITYFLGFVILSLDPYRL